MPRLAGARTLRRASSCTTKVRNAKKRDDQFTPVEFLRIQGAAAVAQMPLSTYLKWLLRGSSDGVNGNTTVILSRLDEISVALARLSSAPPAPARAPATAPRELIEEKLRARGVPSSTIRQVSAVLDDVESGR